MRLPIKGRPRIYDTPEKAEEARKESQRLSQQRRREQGRCNVDVDPPQAENLIAYAKKSGESRKAIVAAALDAYLKGKV